MTQSTEATTIKCAICATDTMIFDGKQKHCPICAALPGEAFKAAAQLRKAIKLATTLAMVGGKSSETTCATTRRLTEKVADVPESSDITWALAAVLMQGGAE